MRERATLLGGTLEAGPEHGVPGARPAAEHRGGARDARVRVLIADDDDLMRAGLAALLSTDPASRWSARPATGAQAVDRPGACARTWS